MQVFISYDHADKPMAEAIKNILIQEGFTPWMDEAIHAGRSWRTEIDQAILHSIAMVVVMSPAAKMSEYVTYEWSFALAAKVPVILVRYKTVEKLHPRLAEIQLIDFTTQRRWDDLLLNLKHYAQPYITQLRDYVRIMRDAADQLVEHNEYFMKNVIFREVIMKSLENSSVELQQLGRSARHAVPSEEYPDYLISLQRKLNNAVVKAIALVDQQEQFWQQRAGREIMESANPNSWRIFVFQTPESFEESFETLLRYAARYHVAAMSFESLARNFPGNAKEFSIIIEDGDKVLAEYGQTEGIGKNVYFSADPTEVANHDMIFDRIKSAAIKMENYTMADLDRLRKRIFSNNQIGKSFVLARGMSLDMDIDDYDEHEERHAYYVDMMQKMVSICTEERERRASPIKPCRILELGAGTGIFTQRLAELPEISCVASEIDFECFYKLQLKMQPKYPKIHPMCVDALEYDYPGSFDYIFSAFSDHHVKIEDKPKYFAMIARKLTPGGLFIVGDEFLPYYEPNSPASRREALEKYHKFIIELAEQEAQSAAAAGDEMMKESYLKVIGIEEDALQSGLNERGDFKVSCNEYKKALAKSGLTVVTEEKIGPMDRDDVGGVYVYTIQVTPTTEPSTLLNTP